MNIARTQLTALLLSAAFIATAQAAPEDNHCTQQKLLTLIKKDNAADFAKLIQQCPELEADRRGFTVLDRARLNGSEAIVADLLKQDKYAKENYSRQMGKLIQSGLRFLSFDAGIVDGYLGKNTAEAIKAYQKKYGFKETGDLSGKWLSDFYLRVVKKMQRELTDMGFDTGGTQGIIGAKTYAAMQAFRQKQHLDVKDYRSIDDQLIYQLMLREHEKLKKALAQKKAAEAAAQRKKEAAARAAAKRRAEAARKKAAAERRARAREAERARRLQETITQMQFGKNQKTTASIAHNSAQQRAEEARRQAEQHAAAAKVRARAAATQRAEEARLARKQQAAQDNYYSNRRKSSPSATSTKSAGRGFNEIKGVLSFVNADTCSVAGHRVGASWCRSYYPSGRGKQCTVIMSNTGMVVSFLCD